MRDPNEQTGGLFDPPEPLAARMRPRTLDEFAGQEHILGRGRLLRRAIEADRLSSLIFHGPPGTGKTTLARIIARTTRAHFIALNAVLGGVKDIREAIAEAQRRKRAAGQRTILFIDEVHRFNKAQQDALLPWVENGTVILIGATTENPFFEVNHALVSRSRIFQLRALEAADLRRVAWSALCDPTRGYGARRVEVEEAALSHLIDVASGDARALLGALELAVETTPPGDDGVQRLTLQVAEESIQRRAVLYDKEGDAHFDTISAFIKSVRGSDPDAALYWLARMVHAGEDPRFILRRLVILASEDIGLGDPQAVAVVMACAQAFDRIGMPEGRYPLAQATLYLATAPKSNTTMAFFDALAAVERERADVPTHLKDPSRDKEGFGHGAGYLYPHAYREHWVAQQYLPDALQGRVFYDPSDQGYEAGVRDQVLRRREAQLEAMLAGAGHAIGEVWTYGGEDRGLERWLQRTLGSAGERMARLREVIFEAARVERHHLVVDLAAGGGLLTWEAVRQAPEGGVFARVDDARAGAALEAQAARLPELRRPIVVAAPLEALEEALAACADAPRRFDRLLGRGALAACADRAGALRVLAGALAPGGRLVLAETLPRRGQRLCALLPPDALPPALRDALRAAEEALYARDGDPRLGWRLDDLLAWAGAAGLEVTHRVEPMPASLHISRALLARWFDPGPPERPSFADRLAPALSPDDLARVRAAFVTHVEDQVVRWRAEVVLLTCTPVKQDRA